MRLKANLTLLLAAIIWGTAFVAQRTAALHQSVFVFNGLRFLIGVLVLLPFTGFYLQFDWPKTAMTLLAGVILFIATTLQQFGIQYTTAGNAGFITSLYVVLVPLLLWIGWREKPRWLAGISVAMAVAGTFLLSMGGSLAVQPGDALELAGAIFWALHVIVVGRYGRTVDSLRFAAGQFLVCGVLSLAIGIFFEHPTAAGLWPVAGSILYTGMFSVGLGYTLQVVAQKHTQPTDAALIMSLESVVAVLSGWLLLGEALLPVQIVGCVLILEAVALAEASNGKIDSFSSGGSP